MAPFPTTLCHSWNSSEVYLPQDWMVRCVTAQAFIILTLSDASKPRYGHELSHTTSQSDAANPPSLSEPLALHSHFPRSSCLPGNRFSFFLGYTVSGYLSREASDPVIHFDMSSDQQQQYIPDLYGEPYVCKAYDFMAVSAHDWSDFNMCLAQVFSGGSVYQLRW